MLIREDGQWCSSLTEIKLDPSLAKTSKRTARLLPCPSSFQRLLSGARLVRTAAVVRFESV